VKPTHEAKRTRKRWLEFGTVGLIGVGVQLGILHVLARYGGMAPMGATAAALEVTLVHNFLWHEQLTWRDRPSSGVSERVRRFITFHAANGGVSLAGNLVLTGVLLHYAGLPLMGANLFAICACSVANFFLADHWVFQAMGGPQA